MTHPRRLAVTMLVMAVALAFQGQAMGQAQAIGRGETMGFDIQGHRGARALRPENTLAGFDHALSIGVTTLEMDVGITADGIVVVSHDPMLNPDITRGPDQRFLDAPGPAIVSLTLAELRRFDVGRIRPGSAYAARYPDQVAVDGQRVPTLTEVVALTRARGADAVRFNIETKLYPDQPALTVAPEVMAAMLADLLIAEGVADRVTIQSFDWRSLRWLAVNRPSIALAWLTAAQRGYDTVSSRDGQPSTWLGGLDPASTQGSIPRLIALAGGRIWSPDHRDLSAETVREAQGLGLKVVPWTVNDRATMDRLVGWGVDGIISDRPDLVRETLLARGIALPASASR